MVAHHADIVIIGGGPGGLHVAPKAVAHGFSVIVIEKEAELGGVCLNAGCIPSKFLLHGGRLAKERDFQKMLGIPVSDDAPHLESLQAVKDQVVGGFNVFWRQIFQKLGVKVIHGFGELVTNSSVKVHKADGDTESVQAHKAVVIASGAQTFVPKPFALSKNILSSKEALELTHVPERLIIIGGGYIGLECGSFWRRMGSAVHVIEAGVRLLPDFDEEVALTLQKSLEEEGMEFSLNSRALACSDKGDRVEVVMQTAGSDARTLEADKVLLAIGRVPYTEGLGLEGVGVEKTDKGFIGVDRSTQQTSVEGVYALGDITEGPLLVHRADRESHILIKRLVGSDVFFDRASLPFVLYTDPQVAKAGLSEEELIKDKVPFVMGKGLFAHNGKAHILGKSGGFLKLFAHKGSGHLLGVHIVGSGAEFLIDKGVLALSMKATLKDILKIAHAHPSLSEVYVEAAEMAEYKRFM